MTWQPINTAPQDGTEVLLAYAKGTVEIGFWEHRVETCNGKVRYDRADWVIRSALLTIPLSNSPKPTHWMPIPVPPQVGVGTEGVLTGTPIYDPRPPRDADSEVKDPAATPRDVHGQTGAHRD